MKSYQVLKICQEIVGMKVKRQPRDAPCLRV